MASPSSASANKHSAKKSSVKHSSTKQSSAKQSSARSSLRQTASEGSATGKYQMKFAPIEKKMEHPQLLRMISRQKEKNASGKTKFTAIIYNKEAGTYFDRTCTEWLRVLVFYCVYYCVLFVMTMLLMVLFLNTMVDERFPLWMGPGTIIGNSPNLKVLAPKLQEVSPKCPIIRYNVSDNNTYVPYRESVRNVLYQYKKPNQGTTFNCSNPNEYRKKSGNDFENSCAVDVNRTDSEKGLGDCFCRGNGCGGSDFGYNSSKKSSPCVAIGLNKVIDWIPDDNENIRDCDDRIIFTCYGKQTMDDEHYDDIKVFPSYGMPMCYFPFYNQKSWQEPFIMLQLRNPKPGVFIEIQCNGTAKHLNPDSVIGQASVEVDFLIK